MPISFSPTKTALLSLVPMFFTAMGCASTQPSARASLPVASADVATGDTSYQSDTDKPAADVGPLKLQRGCLHGHYTTHDRAVGFILDRTSDTWKAKLDGTTEILPLSMNPGPASTKEYRNVDRSIWLRVDEHDNVVLFQGPNQPERVPVVRDASLLIWR